jgi:uncharacterized membrane protein YcaP (DUF421 family)
MSMAQAAEQITLSLVYYAGLVTMMRLAGKRLAGQTTTIDLVVLISLGVVLQGMVLRPGQLNALLFVVTVFVAHRSMAAACARWPAFRRIVRGAPRPLVRDGQVSMAALEAEGLTYDDLLAGLRKSGHADIASVRLAVLEETGHISAISDAPGSGAG